MLSKWPIRNKLLIGIALLVVMVSALSIAGGVGVYRYRDLVRSLELRATELPLATKLSLAVSDLRVTLSEARAANPRTRPIEVNNLDLGLLRDHFQSQLEVVKSAYALYVDQLQRNDQSDYRDFITDDSSRAANCPRN